MNAPSRPPLTDSPWFWLYVFGTAGILALLATSSKFGARQSQLDRQFEGRRHALERPADQVSELPFSSPERRVQSLRPLYILLLIGLIGGWIALWWQRYRPHSRDTRSPGPSTTSAASPDGPPVDPEASTVRGAASPSSATSRSVTSGSKAATASPPGSSTSP